MFSQHFSSRSKIERLEVRALFGFLTRVGLTLNLKFVGAMRRVYY